MAEGMPHACAVVCRCTVEVSGVMIIVDALAVLVYTQKKKRWEERLFGEQVPVVDSKYVSQLCLAATTFHTRDINVTSSH